MYAKFCKAKPWLKLLQSIRVSVVQAAAPTWLGQALECDHYPRKKIFQGTGILLVNAYVPVVLRR